MILWVHATFIEWARWVRRTDEGPAGYGKSVLLKVMEGKGEILPGAPFIASRGLSDLDKRMLRVERFISQLSKRDRRLIKVFYLQPNTVETKAKRLGMSKRSLYDRIHKVHTSFTEVHTP